MVNPLGPAYSNFYMSYFENKVFKRTDIPEICTRYIDDIFVLIENNDEIIILKSNF